MSSERSLYAYMTKTDERLKRQRHGHRHRERMGDLRCMDDLIILACLLGVVLVWFVLHV